MIIHVFGNRWDQCEELATKVAQAALELDVPVNIEKHDDLEDLFRFGTGIMPAVAIDGSIRCSGRIPSVDELKRFLARERCVA